ncbi:hypothetical protein [Haloferula sp. A504]|uniref:hypothetical protein n=1 Tax=Haloferula sp. A504 TaxID=3373601 RepID=UPI0031BEFB8C|nr:hypothetical protein [Verrucomicrobiaceae bacterium E54]
MNLLFEIIIQQGFLLDLFGVIGLGLVAFAALRLAQRLPGHHAAFMTWGALAMIAGRIGILLFTQVVTPFNQEQFDPFMLALVKNANLLLLTGGLGAIVWGFWSHEQQLAAEQGTA